MFYVLFYFLNILYGKIRNFFVKDASIRIHQCAFLVLMKNICFVFEKKNSWLNLSTMCIFNYLKWALVVVLTWLYWIRYFEIRILGAFKQPAKMQNEEGQNMDLYIPRKWYAALFYRLTIFYRVGSWNSDWFFLYLQLCH